MIVFNNLNEFNSFMGGNQINSGEVYVIMTGNETYTIKCRTNNIDGSDKIITSSSGGESEQVSTLLRQITEKTITELVIPTGTTKIEYATFSRNNNLTKVFIPNTVTEMTSNGLIGGAFSSCKSLTDVTLEEGITLIGVSAFRQCTSLQEIDIPSSVTSIGSQAFNGCTSLQSVDIPASVTSIGSQAFSGCTSLTSITLRHDTLFPLSGVLFNPLPDGLSFYVPSNLVDEYKTAYSGITDRFFPIA